MEGYLLEDAEYEAAPMHQSFPPRPLQRSGIFQPVLMHIVLTLARIPTSGCMMTFSCHLAAALQSINSLVTTATGHTLQAEELWLVLACRRT